MTRAAPVALLTGAAGGIGPVTAVYLARRGCVGCARVRDLAGADRPIEQAGANRVPRRAPA